MMQSAFAEALIQAMPEAEERIPLARRITEFSEVSAMDPEELSRMDSAHAAEIAELQGRIDAAEPCRWRTSAQQAARILRLHHQWIKAEVKRREKADNLRHMRELQQASIASKAANLQAIANTAREKQQARLDRIAASNDWTMRQTEVFKEVAREVLGMEMYLHLWEMTRQRMTP